MGAVNYVRPVAGELAPCYGCVLPGGPRVVSDFACGQLAAVAAARASRVAARAVAAAASPTSCTRARSMSIAAGVRRYPFAALERALGGGASEPLAPSASSEAGAFEFPEGLALLDGSLYVADCNHHRVVLLDPTTLAQLGAFGEQGAAPASSSTRRASLGDDQLRLLAVADSQNHRVQLFEPGGAWSVIGGQGCAPGCSPPCGVAVASIGLVVAEDTGRRLQLLTLSGEPRQVLRVPGAGCLWGATLLPSTRSSPWSSSAADATTSASAGRRPPARPGRRRRAGRGRRGSRRSRSSSTSSSSRSQAAAASVWR